MASRIFILPACITHGRWGKRVGISKPELPWETIGDLPAKQPGGITHLNVNEGPEVLQHDHKIFVAYSASACWTDNYALGLLTSRGRCRRFRSIFVAEEREARVFRISGSPCLRHRAQLVLRVARWKAKLDRLPRQPGTAPGMWQTCAPRAPSLLRLMAMARRISGGRAQIGVPLKKPSGIKSRSRELRKLE